MFNKLTKEQQEKILEVKAKITKAFELLKFDEESHTYTVNGELLPSVSGVKMEFFDEFDKEILPRYAAKMGFEEDDVNSAWEGEANIGTSNGHSVHLFGENYALWKYWGIGERPKPTCKKCLGIIEFWNDMPDRYFPIFLELQMYSLLFGYAGTADIICYDLKTGNLVIMDYKTNKSLFSDFNKRILFLKVLLNQDDFSQYVIQFNLYQILLEEIGFKVSNRVLIWLSEQPRDEETRKKKLYKAYKTIDCSKDLREYYASKKSA